MDSHSEIESLRNEFEIQKQIAFKSGQLQSDVTVWSLLQSIAEGVVVVDQSGRILLVNARLEALLGHSLPELIGKPLDVLIPERFRPSHRDKVDHFFVEPRIRPMGNGIDLAARKADGSELPVEISLSFLKTNIGQIGLAFLTDISMRKKSEDALREQNVGLDTFAQAVAHNLKNTISGIVGVSELLKDEGEGALTAEERRDYLTILLESGKKMSDVIKELLLFAKLKREDVELHLLDPRPILENVKFRLLATIKETQASIDLADHFHAALAYEGWVEEILFNLVSNAIKHGGLPPVVAIRSEMLPSNEVAYHVIDNGPGLSAAKLSVLLKEDSPERRNLVAGHGFGLLIARTIAAKLNGRIEARSEEGKGSIFSLVLKGEAL